MGSGTWDASRWDDHSTKTATKTVSEIMSRSNIHSDNDPKNFKVRESRDSATHPVTTPVLFGADVTGSMGSVSEKLIKKGIGIIQGKLLELAPIKGPQLAVAAFGDVSTGDDAPIQMTQFESDMSIVPQMENIWLEYGGGANDSESDLLVYYMAARRVSHDAFEKRGKKGYLFTAGDEHYPRVLTREEVFRATGDRVQSDMTIEQLIEMAGRTFHVYHIVVAEGNHCQHHGAANVAANWKTILGQNVVVLEDIDAIGETVVSIIQINEGTSVDEAVGAWSGGTAVSVRSAVSGLTKTAHEPSTGVVTL